MIQKCKNKFFILVILVIVLFAPSQLKAYNYGGIKWSTNGTTVDSGDASWPWAWVSPLAAAMSAWNGASSPFSFSVGNGHKFKLGNTAPNAIAETYPSWSGTTITNIYTIFNQNEAFSTTGESNKYDVQNIATHELGHWLYLGDLSGAGNTLKTMYYSSGQGQTNKRTLELDDINGINYIYP